MKKYIVMVMVLGLMFFGATKVQAVSMSDLQKQIQALSEQIESLQSQITGLVVKSSIEESSLNNKIYDERGKSLDTFFNNNLTKGDKGDHVKILQTLLVAQNYLENENEIDGSFGLKTTKAVILFQKNNKLSTDGIVGITTKQKLIENYPVSEYEKFSISEINNYIIENKIDLKVLAEEEKVLFRNSTDGKLIAGDIQIYDSFDEIPIQDKKWCSVYLFHVYISSSSQGGPFEAWYIVHVGRNSELFIPISEKEF